jgi:nitrogenase subunit NifH
MGVAVEAGAEAVEEGDGAEPGAGGRRRGVLRAAEVLETEQRLNLIQQNPRGV